MNLNPVRTTQHDLGIRSLAYVMAQNDGALIGRRRIARMTGGTVIPTRSKKSIRRAEVQAAQSSVLTAWQGNPTVLLLL